MTKYYTITSTLEGIRYSNLTKPKLPLDLIQYSKVHKQEVGGRSSSLLYYVLSVLSGVKSECANVR